MKFYLGTHRPRWLAALDVPLFVSRRTLAPLRTPPRARAPWALDSGGFTELTLHGRWTVSAADYAREVRRLRAEVGLMEWAAPQDWMAKPAIEGTHGPERRRAPAPHARQPPGAARARARSAVDAGPPGVVGGRLPATRRAVRRRRHRPPARAARRRRIGLPPPVERARRDRSSRRSPPRAFGCTGSASRRAAYAQARAHLASADSLAWSLHARFHPPLAGHPHKTCANCCEFALEWREELLSTLPGAA